MGQSAGMVWVVLVMMACLGTWCPAHPGHDDDEAPLAAAAQSARNVIEIRGGYRYIESNGIPDHATGAFPNRNNPNRITEQNYRFRMPVSPKQNEQPAPARGRLFGVAVNGVVFDPGTAEFWRDDPSSGWNMEAIGGPRNLGLDESNAHVQPSGAYHYHGIPVALVQQRAGRKDNRPVLIGWAADGFPIYGPLGYEQADNPRSELRPLRSSYRLKAGERPARPQAPGGRHDGSYTQDWHYVAGSGDLDECNGRFGVTGEFPRGTYYYVLTSDFPFIPRLFRGTPDESFSLRGPRGPGGAAGPGRPGAGEGAGPGRRPAPGRGDRPPAGARPLPPPRN